MGFAIGYLLGSLALLAIVIYLTRIRQPAVPQMQAGAGTGESGERERRSPEPGHETCELCGESRPCSEVNDMTVCGECKSDLF